MSSRILDMPKCNNASCSMNNNGMCNEIGTILFHNNAVDLPEVEGCSSPFATNAGLID